MSLLDLSAQFSQKTLNELYATNGYEFLVTPATIGAPVPRFSAPPPITAAEAVKQKTADGVLVDMRGPPPSLLVSDFGIRSADLEALNKPTAVSRLPKFLPDPNVKAFEDIYEQEMERQNEFFAGFEEAKREGEFRRRAYLQAKGFAEGEIAEIMKESRKREGLKALDESVKYAPGGDLTFQREIGAMARAVLKPEASTKEFGTQTTTNADRIAAFIAKARDVPVVGSELKNALSQYNAQNRGEPKLTTPVLKEYLKQELGPAAPRSLKTMDAGTTLETLFRTALSGERGAGE